MRLLKIFTAHPAFCLALILVGSTTRVPAQLSSANSISFQGALTGPSGQPLPSGAYNLTFRFYDGPTGAAAMATTIVTNVTIVAGIASTVIPISPTLFNDQPLYLGISITNGQELLPRILITSAPYSLATRGVKVDTDGGANISRSNGDPNTAGQGNLWLTGAATDGALLLGVNDHSGFVQSHGSVPLLLNPVGNNVGIGTGWPRNRLVVGTTDGDADRMPPCHEALVIGTKEDAGAGTKAGLLFDTNNRNGAGIIVEKVGVGSNEDHRMRFFVTKDGDISSHNYMTIYENGVTEVTTLRIIGGSDLAEPVKLPSTSGSNIKVEPGMVVSIDPTSQRKFKLSEEPYDRKRVGIISGGNGVKPGLLLQDEGNASVEGDQPIALSGQVWCHADASFGAIVPGDLLTTSSTAGHAMKAADLDKARFAVLGQALTGLKAGRGWVQVWVGRQ